MHCVLESAFLVWRKIVDARLCAKERGGVLRAVDEGPETVRMLRAGSRCSQFVRTHCSLASRGRSVAELPALVPVLRVESASQRAESRGTWMWFCEMYGGMRALAECAVRAVQGPINQSKGASRLVVVHNLLPFPRAAAAASGLCSICFQQPPAAAPRGGNHGGGRAHTQAAKRRRSSSPLPSRLTPSGQRHVQMA